MAKLNKDTKVNIGLGSIIAGLISLVTFFYNGINKDIEGMKNELKEFKKERKEW